MSVRVLKKAVAVLETLGAAGRPVGLAELTRQMQFPKPTVYRILRTFLELGYVAQDRATGFYMPTSRLAHLGRHGRTFDLRRRALPALERLHKRFNETVNLGVLEGVEISYVDFLETTRPLRLMVRPEAKDPFYCTALGRAIAAYLPEREQQDLLAQVKFEARTPRTVRDKAGLKRILRETRHRGWAIDDEESDIGVVCLGIPLLEGGYPFAAVSVTVPRIRLTPGRRREILTEFQGLKLLPK